MTDINNSPSFEPVLLNLADNDDYTVLIHALEEYEGTLQGEADDERERNRHNAQSATDSHEEQLQHLANRAARLRLDIERQLEANDDVRGSISE